MPNESKELLSIKNVHKDFGGLRAVDHVSLDLEEGKIQGLIGPNGSGKTTLINLVTGIYPVSGGENYFLGNRISGLSPDRIASLGIIRTFQIARVFRDMTVLENMIIPAIAQGQSVLEARMDAERLLEFALLSGLKNEAAKNLSGGQNMLLQIVRGFMNRRLRLFVMDEPFAGVHASIKGVMLRSIKTMNRERGTGFLIVSHEMSTIRNVCHEVSVLHKGVLIAKGSMDEIAQNSQVVDAYLGG